MSEKNEALENAVTKVATAMLNTSMQNIDASTICGWANALGNAVDQFRDPTKMILPNKVELDENNLTRLNMAKARDVFKRIHEWFNSTSEKKPDVELGKDIFDLYEDIEDALAYPPRKCDIFSKAEILELLKDRSFSKEDTIEWLFSEWKGDIYGID